jgi:FtsH-binding integral membrane protein
MPEARLKERGERRRMKAVAAAGSSVALAASASLAAVCPMEGPLWWWLALVVSPLVCGTICGLFIPSMAWAAFALGISAMAFVASPLVCTVENSDLAFGPLVQTAAFVVAILVFVLPGACGMLVASPSDA